MNASRLNASSLKLKYSTAVNICDNQHTANCGKFPRAETLSYRTSTTNKIFIGIRTKITDCLSPKISLGIREQPFPNSIQVGLAKLKIDQFTWIKFLSCNQLYCWFSLTSQISVCQPKFQIRWTAEVERRFARKTDCYCQEWEDNTNRKRTNSWYDSYLICWHICDERTEQGNSCLSEICSKFELKNRRISPEIPKSIVWREIQANLSTSGLRMMTIMSFFLSISP